MKSLDWHEVFGLVDRLAQRLDRMGCERIWGVPRGGAVVAGLLGAKHGLTVIANHPREADCVVDDIVDSGRTRDRWVEKSGGKPFVALVDRERDKYEGWVTFPWEDSDPTVDLEDTVVRQLEFIGEDVKREGLRETPRRVVKALVEMTSGYKADVEAILSTAFESDTDEMVVVRGIEYASLCEHHMLPFVGTADVAYLPSGRVLGLSKIPRLVRAYALRLQIQENFTSQIADAIMENLEPNGVGVVVRGRHSCCALRGVRSSNEMVTSALRGIFRQSPSVRAEFFQLIGGSP